MSTNRVKFRVDIYDHVMPQNAISLEAEDCPNMGSIALAERNKPWICRMSFSADALRALGRAALVLADQIQPTE
jgi:hypothetical protein